MMEEKEIFELIRKIRKVGKDLQSCEVKQSVGKLPSSICETVSAFANGEGGIILFGLNEENGFSVEEKFNAIATQDAFLSVCLEKIAPVVRPDMEIIPFENGTILAARIPAFSREDKPCYVKDRGLYHGAYIRGGDGDRLLSHYEIDRLLEGRKQPRWDASIIEESSMETDFDQSLVSRLIDRQKYLHPLIFKNMESLDVLQNLRVIGKASDGTLRPTLAGLLALGNYPQKYFPRLVVTFASFAEREGSTDTLRFIDNRTIVGSIPRMVEDAVDIVRRNSRCAAVIKGAFRHDVWDYPLDAVREAVANALQHRDYSPEGCASAVSINMYPDRLEIVNPGGLFGRMTVKTMGKAGFTASRNQFLSSILETTPYADNRFVVENRGSGMITIRNLLAEAGMYPAEMRTSLNNFKITFYKRRVGFVEKRAMSAEEFETQIINELKKHSSLSIKEMIEFSGLSRSTVSKRIKRLVDQYRIEPTRDPKSPNQRYRLVRTLI